MKKMQMDKTNVKAVIQQQPSSTKQLQRFLSGIKFIRFIRAFSSVSAPLTAILKCNLTKRQKWLQWNNTDVLAFQMLKTNFQAVAICTLGVSSQQSYFYWGWIVNVAIYTWVYTAPPKDKTSTKVSITNNAIYTLTITSCKQPNS